MHVIGDPIRGNTYTGFQFKSLQLPPGFMLKAPYVEGQAPGEPSDWSVVAHEPISWDGNGSPPVGVRCERNGSAFLSPRWEEVNILAYTKIGSIVWETIDGKHAGFSHVGSIDKFRPLRTAEQIAHDEREAGITAIAVLMDRNPNSENIRARCAILWDAGYRKQEQSK